MKGLGVMMGEIGRNSLEGLGEVGGRSWRD